MVLLPPAFELKLNKVKLIKPGMRKLQNMETAAVHRGFTSFQMVHTHTQGQFRTSNASYLPPVCMMMLMKKMNMIT